MGGPGSGPKKGVKQSARGPKPQTLRILEMRQRGMQYKEIADALGCHIDTAKQACMKYGITVKQYPVEVSEAIEIINKAGYDYVCGFKNAHSKVTIKCRECGGAFDKMYRHLREKAIGTYQYKMTCPHCYKAMWEDYQDNKRKTREEDRKREAQMIAQQKAEQLSRKVNDMLAKRLASHVCKNCGQEFCIETTGYNSEKYCSKKCQARWHDRVKNDKRMDRLLAREHDTDITLDKLFKRDGGVCYICGCMCDWSDITEGDGTKIAGAKYPSIDHVKPVSKGGTHTWGNIRLACRACNTLKGWR